MDDINNFSARVHVPFLTARLTLDTGWTDRYEINSHSDVGKASIPTLHHGILSQVYLIGDKIVRKFPQESTYSEDPSITIRNEKVAYRQIGRHPRIASWIPSEGGDYIDLEYYPNGSIFDYLDQNKDEVPPALLVQWGSQIIEALMVIHVKDIIHSDLNLKQILLD